MINPRCYKCNRELDEFGGLIIGPPDHDGKCDKKHICTDCYKKEFIEEINEKVRAS